MKRVVITSSVSAVEGLAPKDRKEVYDEQDWTNAQYWDISAYVKSKTAAEMYAWDFITNLKENVKIFCPEIVTICPATIFGEVICSGDQTSSSAVKRVMMNEIMGIPNIYVHCVDIKDCSLAHLRAIERPEAAN